MRFGLLWLLVAIVAEFWSIGEVGHRIGFWATLIWLFADVFFGLQLMRAQGINAMLKNAQNMQAGESPTGTIAESIVKAFAGVLLIIPGFFTDVAALIILLPFVRKGFARHLARNGQFQGFSAGGFSGFGMGGFGKRAANDGFVGGNVYEHEGSAQTKNDDVIEGQVIEHKPDDKK